MAIDFADLAIRVKYDDATKAAKALDDLTAAGQKAEQSTSRLGVSSVAQTRNMGAWAAIQAEATGHVGEHSIAIGRLERALASYVGHAVGAGSATESLIAGLLKFSVGTLETVGVLAGLAAVVGLYELMTSSSREAKKQMDDMTDSLVGQARAAEEATLRGKENLELIAQINREAVQKESGVGFRSVVMSLLTGKPTIDATDAERQATRAGRADTAADQAAKNYADAWKKAEEERTRKMEEEERKREAIQRREERIRLAAEQERGAEIAIAVDAENRHRDEMNAARRLNLVPQSALSPIPGVGQLSAAEQRHMESVIRLDQEYENARRVFSSTTAAVDDFKMGLKEAATGLLQQFSPGAIAQNVVGGVVSKVEGVISGVIGSAITGVRHAIFGSNGEERDAARKAGASAHAMALQLDEVTKALGGDQLGAAIDALQIGLIQSLQAINDAMPGSKNEAARNAAREQAARQEAEQEAQARRRYAEQQQYATEDLAVRNLRATGQGDAADLLAFREKQERELQAAIDANKDATYINTLRMVENNELIAFQNGLLQDAIRNAPTGFYGVAGYTREFATPEGPGSGSDIVGSKLLHRSGGNDAPPRGRGPVNATINVTVDGKVLTSVLVKNLDQVAASTGGTGSSRADALNRVPT